MSRLPFPLVLITGFAALLWFGILFTMFDQAMGPIFDMTSSNIEGEAATAGQGWIEITWQMSSIIVLGVVLLAMIVAASTGRGGLT